MKNKGFTIVELVIVIAVIAILAAVLIPTFTTVVRNANISKASSEAKNALTEYTAAFKTEYPTSEVRDGMVFISGDYAFTNSKNGIEQLELLGTSKVDDPTVEMFLLGDSYDLGKRVGKCMYELQRGDYNVYYIENPGDVNGAYYLWVYQAEEENNHQRVTGFNEAEIYLAAMVQSTKSKDAVINQYNIKTKDNAKDGVLDMATVWINKDSSYTVSAQNRNLEIEKPSITHVAFNGHDILTGGNTDTFAVSVDIISQYFVENGTITDNELVIE